MVSGSVQLAHRIGRAEKILVAFTDSAQSARATALGQQIRVDAPRGVARAVEIIERHAAEFKLATSSY